MTLTAARIIDEAQDYFDESVGELFNQARKYKVGLIVAHQNLDQLKHELRASILASTAIKLVGGMSAWDATTFAKEMRCEREFLQGMQKRTDHTEFACFVRNVTPTPLCLRVPFGAMEASSPRFPQVYPENQLYIGRMKLNVYDNPICGRATARPSVTNVMIDAKFLIVQTFPTS